MSASGPSLHPSSAPSSSTSASTSHQFNWERNSTTLFLDNGTDEARSGCLWLGLWCRMCFFWFRHTGRFDYSLTECRQRSGVCLWSFRRWDCFDWSPWKNLVFLAFPQSRNPTQLPAALWALVQPHCPETPLLRPSWKSGGQERGVVHGPASLPWNSSLKTILKIRQ